MVSELALQAGGKIAPVLLKAFIEVIEGQYLDFQLSVDPIGSSTVDEKRCVLMGGKKTGALIAVAAESAGIAAGQNKKECNRLRAYGMALGMTFQLADDYKSVWSTQKETGKDAQSDIREHKRTLPFFITYAHAKGRARERLRELYSLDRQLTEKEVGEVRAIIDATPAKIEMLERVQRYADSAKKEAWKLSISEKTRAILAGAASMLVPEVSEQ